MEWIEINGIDLNTIKKEFIWFYDQKHEEVFYGVYNGSSFWSTFNNNHQIDDITHYMLIEDKPLPPGVMYVEEVKPSIVSNTDNTDLFEMILKDKKQCPHCSLYVSENHNCLEK